MKDNDTLQLIVIDDSSNDLEMVSNMLRNAGQAVRSIRVEDDEDLRTALTTETGDMILAKPKIPYFTALDALSVVNQLGLDVPFIILNSESDEAQLIEALDAGARDAVAIDEPERLKHVLLREWHDLRGRRDHRHCQTMLTEANKRAQALVDSSRDAIAYVHDGMHIYANASYLQIFGFSDFAEIEGMPVMNLVTPEDHGRFKEFLRNAPEGKALDLQGMRADGERFELTMGFSPAAYEGESCTQVIIHDQSLSKALEAKLDDLSKQDLLTGVYNHQYFLATLDHIVAGGTASGVVLFITVDDFQNMRTELGIAGSDLFLSDTASVLNKQLPGADDILARFEGHLFAAILFDADATRAEGVAAKMVEAMENHVSEIDDATAASTCSIGIALFNEGIRDPQEVLSRADKAREKVAGAGGNGLQVYNPVAEEMAEKERSSLWTRRVKLALKDGRFRLVYQPIVSLHGDSKANYEVLLRMLDDGGRDIMPAEFMPTAEQAGLMTAIDRWVLAHSVKTLTEQRRKDRHANFFVKLSEASLRDRRLLPWLRDLLKATRLEGGLLTLEVTEEVAQTNLKVLKVLVDGLQQLRIRFALDRFGASPHSVNLLRHCRADFLKIDRSLIGGLVKDKNHQAHVKTLTARAKENQQLTIAEYVEDANTLAMLWSCGIDYIQGYFLQEPNGEMSYDFSAF